MEKYGLDWSEVAYIGDDLNDIKLLEKAGLSACPANAPDYVKSRVDWVLTKNGGEGVFREFVEAFLQQIEAMEKVILLFLDQQNSLNQ